MTDLTVAVIQSIPVPGDLERSVRDHVRLAAAAAHQGARIALFPELSLTGYDLGLTPADALSPSDERLRALQSAADINDIVIIAGAPLASTRALLIAAFCFVPGQPVEIYSKRYLHEGEEVAFVAGSGGAPLMVDARRVALAICAEITHSDHAREAARQGAAVYAASCFITPGGYADDALLLETYAREHGMAVMMANFGSASGGWDSGGKSAVWSSQGKLLAQGPAEGEALIVTKLT